MILRAKNPENVLQEELLREKAEVLSRASEKVSTILEQLRGLEDAIEGFLRYREGNSPGEDDVTGGCFPVTEMPKQAVIEKINEKILQYNTLREEAKLRYHYLIITREALGMRKHHWVEAFYTVPARKGYIHDL